MISGDLSSFWKFLIKSHCPDEKFTAAAAIKRQIPLCCCLNACYMCIRNGFIPSSCWVGRQAREAATCAFIIYKRMNIKDYDGKPSRILDNSRFVLNFFSGTYLIYSTNANSQAHLCISESSAIFFQEHKFKKGGE